MRHAMNCPETIDALIKRIDFLESILRNVTEDLIEMQRSQNEDFDSLISAINALDLHDTVRKDN